MNVKNMFMIHDVLIRIKTSLKGICLNRFNYLIVWIWGHQVFMEFFCGISGVNILEEAVTSIPENFGIVSQETSMIAELREL